MAGCVAALSADWLLGEPSAPLHPKGTGRNASPGLVAAAGLVTEMRIVKHPYRDQGIGAQPRIEL